MDKPKGRQLHRDADRRECPDRDCCHEARRALAELLASLRQCQQCGERSVRETGREQR